MATRTIRLVKTFAAENQPVEEEQKMSAVPSRNILIDDDKAETIQFEAKTPNHIPDKADVVVFQEESKQKDNSDLEEPVHNPLIEIEVVDELQADESDSIQLKTFADLLTDMREVESSLIIARVQTRDRTDYRKKYYNYYNASNLIKIIFKTLSLGVNQILQSRYHPEFPLTPKNPLTNEVIVGEVEFFVITLQEQNRVQDLEVEPLIAEFIGSDYNYAVQASFREEFKNHSHDQEALDIGLRSQQEQNRQQNQMLYDESSRCCLSPIQSKAYANFCESLQQQASMGYDAIHVLRTMLNHRTAALDFYGKIMFVFVLGSMVSWYIAIQNILNYDNPKYVIQLDLFTYLLPFFAFIIDAAVKRAYLLVAKTYIYCIKSLIIFVYLALYVISLQKDSTNVFYMVFTVALFLFPVGISIHWVALINGKLG